MAIALSSVESSAGIRVAPSIVADSVSVAIVVVKLFFHDIAVVITMLVMQI